MCLITTNNKLYTATKDIKCYKLLQKKSFENYSSIHYSKAWQLNKINRCQLKIMNCNDYPEIYKYPNDDSYRTYRSINPIDKFIISKGFHANLKLKLLKKYYRDWEAEGYIYLLCIIPKGAKYYKDSIGGIVSNQMMPIKEK